MRPNQNRRLSNFQIGLIAIVLTFIGFYLAFTKTIPFVSHGYELKAVFPDAQNIRAKSPVRISGQVRYNRNDYIGDIGFRVPFAQEVNCAVSGNYREPCCHVAAAGIESSRVSP